MRTEMNHWRAVCRQTCKHGSAGDGWKRTRCAPRQPSTRLLKRVVEDAQVPDLRLKLDPGSRKSGVAIVNQTSGQVVFAAEIEHRGEVINRLWMREGRFGAVAAQERPDTASPDFSTGRDQRDGYHLH
jgi:hypothetical protein